MIRNYKELKVLQKSIELQRDSQRKNYMVWHRRWEQQHCPSLVTEQKDMEGKRLRNTSGLYRKLMAHLVDEGRRRYEPVMWAPLRTIEYVNVRLIVEGLKGCSGH